MPAPRKWTYETIQQEALKYARRSEFQKGSQGAYGAALKLGIIDDVCAHMTKIGRSWDAKSIKEEALKYDGRKKFMDGCYGAYKAAKRLGIVEEVCAHMHSRYWTKTRLIEVAKEYSSLKKFMKEQKGAYIHATRNGLLDEVTQHMERLQMPHGYWSIEKCKEEAKKYQYRNQFQKESGGAYTAALKNGWLDKICPHMKSHADGYNHCVYAILNTRKNLAYIGITRQIFKSRIEGHRNKSNTASSKKIANLKDTEFIQLTDYLFDANQVEDAEFKWFKKYKRKGFIMLNDEKQLGRTGTDTRIHTDEIIFAEARKYKTRVEFKNKSPKIYDAACTYRLLEKACSHMRGIAKKNFWTKEECIKYAKTCNDKGEFAKGNNGAYSAARINGWLEEIYQHLRSKNDMSWLRPATRKDVWCFADEYFDTWVENDRCGYSKLYRLTNVRLDKMHQKFKEGWIPAEDPEWRDWAEEIKSRF